MTFFLALLAAFGCAVFNGTAAVLQKVSADKEERAVSLRSGMMFRLLKDWPYLTGLILDFLAWILTLIAVHSLPLFMVQPIVAFSVVVTLLIEIVVLRIKLNTLFAMAIALIALGLVLLVISSKSGSATNVASSVKVVIITAPLLLAVIGMVGIKGKSFLATGLLAGTSGLAFGGTSIVGRMLHWHEPYLNVLISPMFISMIAYGLVGMLLFTVALQRHMASVVNAIMITFETLAPVSIGILFLGDRPKHGLWLLVIFGAGMAISGIMLISAKSADIMASPDSLLMHGKSL